MNANTMNAAVTFMTYNTTYKLNATVKRKMAYESNADATTSAYDNNNDDGNNLLSVATISADIF